MTDLLLLPGDGIGPEVTAQVRRVAEALTPDLAIEERLFGGKVYLEVWVKVKSGWNDDERLLKSLGYE